VNLDWISVSLVYYKNLYTASGILGLYQWKTVENQRMRVEADKIQQTMRRRRRKGWGTINLNDFARMAVKCPIFVDSVETNTRNMSATKGREASHTLNINMRFVCMTNNESNVAIAMDAACVIIRHKEVNAQYANQVLAKFQKLTRKRYATMEWVGLRVLQ
jgi:hypothetical protein